MSRTFTIHQATKTNGCPTKVPSNSRYNNDQPSQAAKKALTSLCNRKRIRGSCALIITMKETTAGSAKKLYTYKVTRSKLDEPVVLDNGATFEYETHVRKARPRKTSRSCKKSSGRIARSRRTSRKRSRKQSGRR